MKKRNRSIASHYWQLVRIRQSTVCYFISLSTNYFVCLLPAPLPATHSAGISVSRDRFSSFSPCRGDALHQLGWNWAWKSPFQAKFRPIGAGMGYKAPKTIYLINLFNFIYYLFISILRGDKIYQIEQNVAFLSRPRVYSSMPNLARIGLGCGYGRPNNFQHRSFCVVMSHKFPSLPYTSFFLHPFPSFPFTSLPFSSFTLLSLFFTFISIIFISPF